MVGSVGRQAGAFLPAQDRHTGAFITCLLEPKTPVGVAGEATARGWVRQTLGD